MIKKLMYPVLLIALFLIMPRVSAMSAAEVSAREKKCPNLELATANNDGTLSSIACYDTYNDAKQAMNSNSDNDNLVIIESGMIIDAKYALVDYDQGTSAGYTNVYTSQSGKTNYTYIRGGNTDDAVFLEVDYPSAMIKIKVSGVVGWIHRYEPGTSNRLYDIVPLAWVKSPGYYQITNEEIIHYLTENVYGTKGKYSLNIGKKPTMVQPGDYYSYDGNYFYKDLKTMINDYKGNSYQNSVNPNNPFYNYYQYLSFRTKTNYTADNINQYISSRTKQTSKLINSGQFFINSQNNYGINALIMFAIGINESGYGNSDIAQDKNNIFGLNAIDISPGLSADTFASVEDCVTNYAYSWLAYGYVKPGDYRFRGANVGNKNQGLNIYYASDPYWGEKAAQYYYDIDKYFGFQDYNQYRIAVLNNNYNNEVYPKKNVNGDNVSTEFYKYQYKNSGVVVLGEVEGPSVKGNTKWFKIMSDPTLSDDLNYIGDSKSDPKIIYNWDKMHVYVPAAYFNYIDQESKPIDDNPSSKPINTIVTDANYKYSSGTIYGITPGTTIETISGNLSNTGGVITITDANGNTVTSGNIGTNYKVNITSNTTETLTVIIYGDTDGDGNITAVDYVRIKNHIMNNSQLTSAYLSAADINGDQNVSAVDYVNVKNYIMGNDNVIKN